MTCALELVTVSTGGREALDRAMLPEDFEQLSGATLSPDGRAIALRRDGEESERVLVTLGSGETAAYPIVGWDQRAGWAADGSGVFDVVGGGDIGAGGGGGDDGAGQGDGDGAIRFTSLDGNSVVFGDELGRITALGVRWPEAEIEPERTVVTREITPASPIGQTGITLTAATRVGAMSIIDVDAGVARTWEMTDGVGRVPLTLLATGDGTVVLPDSDRRAFVTGPSDERSLSTAFDVTGLKLPGPAPDTVWVPSGGPEGDGVAYSLLPLAASSPDEALATVAIRDAELLGSDGRGGLVVARGGDVFVVDGAGTTRLTSGQLVAIRGEIAYVRECDDVAECALIRVNRATGQRDVVAGFAGPDSLPGATPVERGAALATSVAPGGEVVVALVDVVSVVVDDTGTTATTESATIEQMWAFVDLIAGTVTVVPDLDARQPVIWSPDAGHAVVLAETQLQVYDRAAATLVALDIDPVVAIGPAPPLDASP